MDARDAISFVMDPRGNSRKPLPALNKERIFLLGYSTGSLVAMYAGAQDPRVTGIACFSGWTPLKDSSQDKVTGGNWRLWGLHGLQPMLGLFRGKEKNIPYDYDAVFELIMPKPLLLVTPKRNRFTDQGAIADLLGRLRLKNPEVFKDSLTWLAPDEVDHFQKDQQMSFIDWVRSLN
jgi:pimeloyl-ACP methyl ester carboxylesterase